jgi:malate synthase
MFREDILRQFPELFGTNRVNGWEINVEDTIATLTRELNPEIAAALTSRSQLLSYTGAHRKN